MHAGRDNPGEVREPSRSTSAATAGRLAGSLRRRHLACDERDCLVGVASVVSQGAVDAGVAFEPPVVPQPAGQLARLGGVREPEVGFHGDDLHGPLLDPAVTTTGLGVPDRDIRPRHGARAATAPFPPGVSHPPTPRSADRLTDYAMTLAVHPYD